MIKKEKREYKYFFLHYSEDSALRYFNLDFWSESDKNQINNQINEHWKTEQVL